MNKIYVVGIGPGAYEQMTVAAADILRKCEVIVGYTVYVDLLREHFTDKAFLTTAMRQETERCRMAFEEAQKGKLTAVVCSGDAGIYGMAGLMLELSEVYPETQIEVVPGVTAALGGGAVLGAPLGHDCAFISLSDLLTPWEIIEKRLLSAAEADFAVCLYNPSSRKRKDYLQKACQVMLKAKSPDTVCGLVKNIARSGEEMKVLTLRELADTPADMFVTVFIGNSDTKVIRGRMVTPRGYRAVLTE
ncbi:MAG: precorrin-3B C(17)-methyltransferase [Dorea sp.]|nr:precorrin-3B C(17)-methyltransferase [Dorea sp.]